MATLENILVSVFGEDAPTIRAELKTEDVTSYDDLKVFTADDLEQVLKKLSGSVGKKAKLRDALLPHIKPSSQGTSSHLYDHCCFMFS